LSISGLVVSFAGQTKTRKTNQRPIGSTKPEAVENKTQAVEAAPEKTPTKKNDRPTSGNPTSDANVKAKFEPNYFYEFSQPAFTISKIVIAHDETGKGTISFTKNVSSEEITDPIQLSPAALERINATLAALDFFNSEENYQYEKDYSHLGNIKIRIKKDGKERETKFNWTQNTEARKLSDEYRKIGNQFIWIFDMNLARTNQPLNAPQLMDVLDSYRRRNEISDAAQMVPYLKEVSNDERIPLIARNHAARLIKEIEKEISKK
jgi:hypothetical protein